MADARNFEVAQNAGVSGGTIPNPAPTAPLTPAAENPATPIETVTPTESLTATHPAAGQAVADSMDPVTSSGTDPLQFLGFDIQRGIDLIDKGGPVVAILLLLSTVAVTVALVKLFQFALVRVGSTATANKALRLWIAGRHQDAYATASGSNAGSAVILSHGMRGLMSGIDERTVREDVERVALAHLSSLRSYMRVLDSTVQIAPLLGLFGTVLGMISAFQALQNAGAEADPTVLAGGIWVALLTTAVGLAIAIPMAFVNTWFEGRIEREKENVEGLLTGLFTRRATDGLQSAAPANDFELRLPHAAE